MESLLNRLRQAKDLCDHLNQLREEAITDDQVEVCRLIDGTFSDWMSPLHQLRHATIHGATKTADYLYKKILEDMDYGEFCETFYNYDTLSQIFEDKEDLLLIKYVHQQTQMEVLPFECYTIAIRSHDSEFFKELLAYRSRGHKPNNYLMAIIDETINPQRETPHSQGSRETTDWTFPMIDLAIEKGAKPEKIIKDLDLGRLDPQLVEYLVKHQKESLKK